MAGQGAEEGASTQITVREIGTALIRSFTSKGRERYSVHDEIEADYFSFERDGRKLLQIDTHGRSTRENPGKQSQTIQLDKEGAAALFQILKNEFHFD